MRICNCILAGTKACETCFNNTGTYSYSTTTVYPPISTPKKEKNIIIIDNSKTINIIKK